MFQSAKGVLSNEQNTNAQNYIKIQKLCPPAKHGVVVRIMKIRLPRLVILVVAFLIVPLRFAAIGSFADSPDSMADPGKYSDDWRANGPPGGDVRSLVVDPSNPDRFYLGTLDAQIYTSADAGKSWELLYNFNKPKLFVDHIIVDPRDPRILYVAAHRHKEAGGFFKSTDEIGRAHV